MATSGTTTFDLDLNEYVESLDGPERKLYHTQTEAQNGLACTESSTR